MLNEMSPTHINVDLTMCTSTLAQRLKWEVLPDIYSSDHLPITNFMTRIGESNKIKVIDEI